MGARHAVEYQGARCGDIKTGWTSIVEDAGLLDVTPHTLRHTAITWALQRGAKIWVHPVGPRRRLVLARWPLDHPGDLAGQGMALESREEIGHVSSVHQ